MTSQPFVDTAAPAAKPEPTSTATLNGHATCNGSSKQTSNDAVSPSDETPLFSDTLISPEVLAALPPDYTIRPLRRSDYARGYLDVLRVLTVVGDISEDDWNDRYNWMAARGGEYFLLVVCDGAGRIVGTGSLIVEHKFVHSLGKVGHIEDIAVEKGQQGKKLGLRIIHALDYIASHVGCYKVCSQVSFSVHSFFIFMGLVNAFLFFSFHYRAFSTVPRQTKASMLSVASGALV